MSVKLPVLDQKITYVRLYFYKILNFYKGEHHPHASGLTPHAYPSSFDKIGSSGRHDSSKMFPLSQRDIKLHENGTPKSFF